jgi:hypothetical protein
MILPIAKQLRGSHSYDISDDAQLHSGLRNFYVLMNLNG